MWRGDNKNGEPTLPSQDLHYIPTWLNVLGSVEQHYCTGLAAYIQPFWQGNVLQTPQVNIECSLSCLSATLLSIWAQQVGPQNKNPQQKTLTKLPPRSPPPPFRPHQTPHPDPSFEILFTKTLNVTCVVDCSCFGQ